MAHLTSKRVQKHLKPDPSIARKPHTNQEKSSLWRVIAPYVTIAKKLAKVEQDDQFSFYLKKKPAVLLRDLSAFMYDSVDLPSLFHETSNVLGKVTKATEVTLYLVDRATNEIYPSYPSNPLNAWERFRVKWKIQEGTIISAYVACRKEYVMVDDIICDDRFPEGVAYAEYKDVKSVLCVPVITPHNECFAVIELSKGLREPPFSLYDLRICVMVTAWMGVAIHQNQERLALKRQQELNDYLLELVKCYFEDHVLMEKLMSEVVKFAKVTLGAERGSFFIIDQESDDMVAYLFDEGAEDNGINKTKVRFGKERGIAGLVARTGVTVNIKDAYNDSRFNKEIDQKTGFITRSILCMPILGPQGVLGVVQVINKKNGGCFTSNDETLFKTFSLYCSMVVHYANVHSIVNKRNHRNNIQLRLLKLQHNPCVHDLKQMHEDTELKIPVDFHLLSWYINSSQELKLAPRYILYMMINLLGEAEVNRNELIRFILIVKKYYREDNPYHNFEHAFNVCHCMYLMLYYNIDKFTKLEVKALLIACFCHDIDHPGFTNSFLALTKHDLAVLYPTSSLENHHANVIVMLLGECKLFPKLSEKSTKLFYDAVREIIVDTDLSNYFEKKVALEKTKDSFDWQTNTHRTLLKSLMVTAADLSGLCKPFLNAKRITENIYREFYRQGDREKELGVCPLSIMDREKEESIPEDQIRFLDVIVIPCTKLLRSLLPNTDDLYSGATQLRKTWQEIVAYKGTKIWRQDDSIVRAYYE